MSEAICEECGKAVAETHAPCQSGMILGQPCRPVEPSEESKKPKAEGWYWRLPEDGGDDLADRPEVVEIYDSADEGLMVDLHRVGQRSLAIIPGSFVGPLTPEDLDHLVQLKARAETAERGLGELGRAVGRALVAATLGEQERLADRKDPEHAIVACVLGLKDELFEAERELTACRSELAQSTADTIRLSQQLDRLGLPASDLDERGRRAVEPLDRAHRAERGQFFTPAPIARYMASLLDAPASHGEPVRLLDPGAGIGSTKPRKQPPRSSRAA